MLRPPPQLTVSQWADQHRVLSTRASSEPGPWRTSRTPYLRDIMDALSAVHPARRVVFMKGAQVGASEGGNCWLGYIMHHVPAPVLAVQPTVELAKRFSRQRIDPLLEETPALRERVAPARASPDNSPCFPVSAGRGSFRRGYGWRVWRGQDKGCGVRVAVGSFGAGHVALRIRVAV